MKNNSAMIYVVDDDNSVCRSTALLLQSNGFKVETFTTAEDFLAFKHSKVASCLVLDIRLPNINGFALQNIIAERGMVIPIIFITGHGNIPMSVKAMKAGAIDFLPKPFTEKKLVDAIVLAIAKSKIHNKQQDEIAKIKRRVDTLSVRELEVFRFVAQGMLNKQIAFKRGTAIQTIKVHRSRVMHKMQAKTVTELIHFARKAGLVSL
ncbi:MAG: response regulator transcription factor [Candidatus Omnitrophica bacterium]|nr:response regulator transcription factor [Candidatus Omnitrophota bacterium]